MTHAFSWFRHHFVSTLLFTACVLPVHASTVTGNLPLQIEPSGSNWNNIIKDATTESTGATPGGTPKYHSTKLEETSFTGDFTADSITTNLAIFSDDGSDVTISDTTLNGPATKVWAGRDQGQALPDLSNSLHLLPITLISGHTYHIVVDYSNTTYGGKGDIDGVTLFAFEIPNVTAEVNNTNDKIDDKYVRLKSSHPGALFTTPVLLFNLSDTQSVTVTISNPDGKLGFTTIQYPSTDSPTLSIGPLPHNSGKVIYITGHTVSSALGDAEIDVTESISKFVYPKKNVTVFGFSNPQMNVTVGGNYTLAPTGDGTNSQLVAPPNAVALVAQASIIPKGVNYQAPQINRLKIGIIQNGFNRTDSVMYSNPQVTWADAETSGSVTIYQTFGGGDNYIPTSAVDSDNDQDRPFYRVNPVKINNNIIATGLVPITSETTVCSDSDDPTSLYRTLFQTQSNDTNHQIATINYNITQATINTKFEDWCTIYDSTIPASYTGQYEWLCESSWAVNIDNTNNTKLSATIGTTQNNTSFVDIPIVTGDTCNDLGQKNKSMQINGSQSTKTIIYPNIQ